jgi:hypothetical protein
MKILTRRRVIEKYQRRNNKVSLYSAVSYLCTALFLECLGSYQVDTGIYWIRLIPGYTVGIDYYDTGRVNVYLNRPNDLVYLGTLDINVRTKEIL